MPKLIMHQNGKKKYTKYDKNLFLDFIFVFSKSAILP